MGTSVFQLHTVEQHTQSFADYLPNGKTFQAKNITDSTFRKFLRGLSQEFQRIEQSLIETSGQHDINCAEEEFLSLWERAVGIPDDCFDGGGTIDERRLHVILKLAQMNVSTEQDFVDLAASLGFTITIGHPIDNAFPPFDIPLTVTGPMARFIWEVAGLGPESFVPPYDIPLFLDAGTSILICVFEQLKPAMTQIVFLE